MQRYIMLLYSTTLHMGVRNLPKVLTRQQPGQESNPVSAIHKSDALPVSHRYRRRCPDPIARIQKFYKFIRTPEKSVHRVTIRNNSAGLVGRGRPNQRSKLTIKLFAK